jgi:hypothetical protein
MRRYDWIVIDCKYPNALDGRIDKKPSDESSEAGHLAFLMIKIKFSCWLVVCG